MQHEHIGTVLLAGGPVNGRYKWWPVLNGLFALFAPVTHGDITLGVYQYATFDWETQLPVYVWRPTPITDYI